MIIKDIILLPNEQRMLSDLHTSSMIHSLRKSWIIKIIDKDNIIGYGEASPLDNFNIESFDEAGYALEGFRIALKGLREDMDLSELLILADVHTFNCPSAHFALETALYDVESRRSSKALCTYLNPSTSTKVAINGIEGMTKHQKYKIIKIKSGFRNIYDEKKYLEQLTLKYGENVKFRVDLNEAYDLPKAIRFCKEINDFNIDYIEQPLNRNAIEDTAELRLHTDFHIALDESVYDFASVDSILEHNAADVFIVKPQVIGGFSRTNKLIKHIASEQKRSIITSLLEFSIGRISTLHLSAANNIKEVCGLALEKIYPNELTSLPIIDNGFAKIPNNKGLGVKYL